MSQSTTFTRHYSGGDRDSIARLINVAIENLYSAVLGGVGCFDRDVLIEIDQYRNRQPLLIFTRGDSIERLISIAIKEQKREKQQPHNRRRFRLEVLVIVVVLVFQSR
jgi:hypothetical protein